MFVQESDNALLDELLGVSINSRERFIEILDKINREIMIAATSTEEIPDSDLSDNAGSGPAGVQGTPFGQIGPDTADDGATDAAEAVPFHAAPDPARNTAPGNAQDADNNRTLNRIPSGTNLAVPPTQPGAAAVAVPPTHQPADVVRANAGCCYVQ